VHSAYASKRPDVEDEGDVDEPAEGFLWDRAISKGISFRDYGELAVRVEKTAVYRASKRSLSADLNPDYPEFDMKVTDQHRADIWLAEFAQYVRDGALPSLEIVQLPRDHTGGGKAGYNTPRACIADNDYAFGRMVEAVSKSPYWADTVFFVIEDDAQYGSDHIDSHRSVCLIISAYNKAGVVHRFLNTTDIVATIEQILGLDPMSQFDFYGRPLADVFSATADMKPFTPIAPLIPLDEMNPATGSAAKKSAKFDLSKPDAVDDATFNRVLWEIVKGERPSRPQSPGVPPGD
jgi:phosphoesterase family protein